MQVHARHLKLVQLPVNRALITIILLVFVTEHWRNHIFIDVVEMAIDFSIQKLIVRFYLRFCRLLQYFVKHGPLLAQQSFSEHLVINAEARIVKVTFVFRYGEWRPKESCCLNWRVIVYKVHC